MDIYEIIPGLYQGPTVTPSWETVRTHGIDTVVALDAMDANVPADILYICWPIADGPLPNLSILLRLAQFLHGLLDDGHTILVHCGAGINRSGLLNALVVAKHTHVRGYEAVGVVRTGRHGALTNAIFARFVEEYG